MIIIYIEKIDGDFVEEHFRKEYVIDNYNKFSGDEEIKKDLNNDLLSEKIENINTIFKWFKDKDGYNSIKKLFINYPKNGGVKIFLYECK